MSTYTIPNVITRGVGGERIMDVYSHLLSARIVYLGTAIDAGVANALIAQLLFELFLEILHLPAQIACGIEIPMPIVVSPRESTASLLHFFPGKFSGELLLLSLTQDGERHFRSFGESLQKLSQLARLDQNLVVQHFEDVVLLNASSSSGAVRLYIIDNQPEAFRQTKLFTHDGWHL